MTLDRELLSKATWSNLSDFIIEGVFTERFSEQFPLLPSESMLKEKLGFASAVIVIQVEEVCCNLLLFNDGGLAIR